MMKTNQKMMKGPEAKPAPRRPTILIIMDGIGLNPSKKDNAVALARTPNLDQLFSRNPTTVIEASGRAVGLPDGQMGNSEVGHLTLGCGSVMRQDLVKINDTIADGTFKSNDAFQAALSRARKNNRPIHLLGLVSDGGIHSHINHLSALIQLCADVGVKPLLHMITDGRDTLPQCSNRFASQVEPVLSAAGGHIASICGRFYAMDRDNRWERVQVAWDLLINGKGVRAATAVEGIRQAWAAGQTDEFIEPIVLPAFEAVGPDDEVIFFNFRNDRPRELSVALSLIEFTGFDRPDYKPVSLTTLTRYEAGYPFPVAFEKEVPEVTLGQVVAEHGIAQLRSAETEKYPHVTFFFSGGREIPFELEERVLVESPKVATYDLQPEMSAYGIRDAIVAALNEKKYGLIVVNFANGDMVGHTGVADAVVQAVEVVDEVVGDLCKVATDNEYSIVLTADHGNADMLIDPTTGGPHTQHTTFPVACTVIDKVNWRLANAFGLPSIAPTILQLMGIPQPEKMTAPSLLLEELPPA